MNDIRNIWGILKKHKDNNDEALCYKSEVITYSELYKKSVAFCRNLSDYSHIGICMPNSIDFVIAFFGIMAAGKTAVPVNIQYTPRDIENVLKNADVDALICQSGLEPNITNPDIDIIYIDELVCSDILPVEVYDLNPAECAVIFPTSGTTGSSKLVQLSHQNIIFNVNNVRDINEAKSYERELAILPFTTAFGFFVEILPCMLTGMKIFIMDGSFNPSKVLRMIESERINYLVLVPALLKNLIEYYEQGEYNIECLKRVSIGGDKVPLSVFEISRKKLPGLIILQGYGMTETSPVITAVTYRDYEKCLTNVGKAVEGVEIKFVTDGMEMNHGETGELFVKGANVMMGYYKDANATLQVLADGWLKTGDIGYQDKNGFIHISGRSKNIVIVGGKNVFPEEIELILKESGLLRDVYVYGKESEIMGEKICADIVSANKDMIDVANRLKQFCVDKLAAYEIPKEIHVVEKIEKNSMNKILRDKKSKE